MPHQSGGTYHNSVLKADGTIVAWSSRSIPLAPPGDFSSAVAISAGLDYTLALAPNLAPKATSQLTNGYASRDTVLTLAGTDSDTDVLKFKIVTLPALGTLYQYAGGSRSLSMLDANTTVSDPLGRVIFAPVPDTYGSPYANLQFVANDGTYDSTAATVTINLVQFRISSYSRASNGSFQLGFNGLTNAVYNVFASTNLTNWLQIGPAIQLSPGLFQFGDPTATNYQQRFYQLRAP